MNTRPLKSSRTVLGISVLAAAAILIAGAANAQVAYIDGGNLYIDHTSGNTVRAYSGGDIFLGGNGWTGEIYLTDPSDNTSGRWITSTLTLGATGDDGDIILKDSINNATTINMDGALGYIILGNSASTEDGDLSVLDSDGTSSIYLDGGTGNVTNQYGGNGLVKAWAEISAAGTVTACWRCNTSTAETRKLSTGTYEVDFTFNTTIATRPRTALLDTHTTGSAIGMIGLADRAGDATSVYVRTYSAAGAAADQPFTIVIY